MLCRAICVDELLVEWSGICCVDELLVEWSGICCVGQNNVEETQLV